MTEAPDNPSVIQASNVSYRASNGQTLVSNVSLDVHRGEIIALAGPNGAGKTTLLRMLAGLIAPTSGSISLFGQPISALLPRERATRIAIAGQHDSPDSRLTVIDYVALGRIPHGDRPTGGEDTDIIGHAVDLTGLGSLREATLDRLSGGELQRAIIARAICQQPEILFLDEPTNHLDPRAKRDVLNLIAELGITTVTVLHDLTLIPGLADRTLLLDCGVEVGVGRTGDVLIPSAVKSVFGVDYHFLNHPEESRMLPVLDVSVDRTSVRNEASHYEKRNLQ